MEYTPSSALSEAAAYLSSAPSLAKVSNTTRLEVEQLYGLYKYLTVASVPENTRPSLFDLTGRAKWDAWDSTGKVYAGRGRDAERRYLDIARELGWLSSGFGLVRESQEREVWDEDLGVSISLSSTAGRGGMGGSVSAMAAPEGGDDDAEEQALHGFAIRGDADGITRFLVKSSSVDVNGRDEYGYTALHLACDRGSLPVTKVLIKHGADAAMKDPDDLTGLELAQIAGHDEICAFLQTELQG